MDLTRDVLYRGYLLNDEDIQSNIVAGDFTGSGISGCVIDNVDWSDVDVVQFMEKRSQQDGMDAGQPFLGARRLRVSGTLYGYTRALLYDAYMELRAVMSPVLAYRDEPLDKGYQPLYFTQPTNRIADYATGYIDLRVLALPRAFQAVFQIDGQGGAAGDALAIPWQATFICKDPSITGDTPQDYDLYAAASGNTINRGTYLCPVDMLIIVGTAAGSLACIIGDSVFTITIPASAGNRTLRFKGADKMFTVEENSVELPRMDLISFVGTSTWPLIAPGTVAYAVTPTAVTVANNSHMWFYEQYA